MFHPARMQGCPQMVGKSLAGVHPAVAWRALHSGAAAVGVLQEGCAQTGEPELLMLPCCASGKGLLRII